MTQLRRGRPPRVVPQKALFETKPTSTNLSLNDLLDLLEPEGAFLTPPVLKRAFPNGIPRLESERRHLVREQLGAFFGGENNATARHTAWRRFLLRDVLEWGDCYVEDQQVPAQYAVAIPEQRTIVRPNAALLRPEGTEALLLVFLHPEGTAFDRRPRHDQSRSNWAASPLEQAERVCRDTGVPLALLSDGERMTLLFAPKGEASGSGTFVTSLFTEEPGLLDAFVALLEARRFFAAAPTDMLDALLRESAAAQAEVTTTLGRQVRAAVELLADAIGRADRETHGQLLKIGRPDGLTPNDVYNGAVSVLMRLVFLLSAEERSLFPLSDRVYASSYAVASLREQLREQARDGIEALERRTAAWHRILALFRAVHGGVDHSEFRFPAYGGSFFDPDRYPFLEGRDKGTSWRETVANPLPVDDRTILEILNGLKVLRLGSEARTLSYRTLEVEQIGHVYESLLDHGCVVAESPTLGFTGQNGEEVTLDEAEAQLARGDVAFQTWLQETAGLSTSARRRLEAQSDEASRYQRLRSVCDWDNGLADRIRPFLPYLRTDMRGDPSVVLPDSLYVTRVSARRDSGAQYTTRELADEIVKYALEPLVYKPGPAEGAPPEEWQLIPAGDILKLKVCDPAVGSGAILVAAGRFLAGKLIEAWDAEEASGVTRSGLPPGTTHADDDEVLAFRAIADHCLYGVDRDPLAAEMAKLSLWLTTLSKERPFTFLDHAIQCGDSLLGIASLDELDILYEHGRLMPANLRGVIAEAKEEALAASQLLMEKTVLTVRDADEKAAMHRDLEASTATLKLLADVVTGSAIASCARVSRKREEFLQEVGYSWLAEAFDDRKSEHERQRARHYLAAEATEWLNTDLPAKTSKRIALHWPLAFPEVFLDPSRGVGFDTMVGNPPFLGGKRISGATGSAFREYLVEYLAEGLKGNADLVAYFYRRCAQVSVGIGMLATNTIAQGDTREIGLDRLVGANKWTIHRAIKSRPWPGVASLEVSQLWLTSSQWHGPMVLDQREVSGITSSLDSLSRVHGLAESLHVNSGQAFLGSMVNGIGFVVDPVEAREVLQSDPASEEVLFRYINGEELNESPTQQPGRWIINFRDWPEDRAQNYRACYNIVRERVKPSRDRLPDTKKRERERWWQFERRAVDLYDAIAKKSRVTAQAVVSKVLLPVFLPTGMVYSNKVVVFPYDDDFHFGVLSSSFHWWWALTHTSTMRRDPNYSPTDCFANFPQPHTNLGVGTAGRDLNEHRAPLMIASNEGLTKTYNRVHNPAEDAPGIMRLRELHVALDYAVREAYGWDDDELKDLNHGFHETSQGVRYTIGPEARREVLDRLLELNHERYAEEVAKGLHDRKTAARRRQ